MIPPRALRALDPALFQHISLTLRAGQVVCEIAREDLEYAALQFARDAAQVHGVEITGLKIELTDSPTGSLHFSAHVTAKKIIFTAKVRITGQLTVTNAMQATLTDLACAGDGMTGDLAAGAIRSELKKYENRPVSLALPPGFPLRVGEIQLRAGPPLRLSASVLNASGVS